MYVSLHSSFLKKIVLVLLPSQFPVYSTLSYFIFVIGELIVALVSNQQNRIVGKGKGGLRTSVLKVRREIF